MFKGSTHNLKQAILTPKKRSRALDLPGIGHSMVPCMDMANHASGDSTSALYETDSDGNAILVLQDDTYMAPNDEVTITYGDEKGACEMLFSYGFIESIVETARELFLDLDMPNDDPLKLAKKAVAQSAPGFRLFLHGDSTDWQSSFIWLLCVNEEDGLEFKVLQNNDGERELQASWKDEEITDMSTLVTLLKLEPLWDVFELRAITTLQTRVEQQLLRLEGSKNSVDELLIVGDIDNDIGKNAMRLRELEEILMLRAYGDFETKVSRDFLGEEDNFANVFIARSLNYSSHQSSSSILTPPWPRVRACPKTIFLKQ